MKKKSIILVVTDKNTSLDFNETTLKHHLKIELLVAIPIN